jgi:nicotinamidase-related amidase
MSAGRPGNAITNSFEDHCWKDVISPDVLELYTPYQRELSVGPAAALLAIDLYELVFQGGARPVRQVTKQHPSACGEYAWAAIRPTRTLFDAARAAGLPIFYTTRSTERSGNGVRATNRRGEALDPELYEIKTEFAPEPGDVVIRKSRASAFFGTPLITHLTRLGIDSVLVCGETTSGCVRASAVDAYSYGFHVVVVEECCFDRSELSHKVNLFDLHHKYADVMHVDDVVAHLAGCPGKEA